MTKTDTADVKNCLNKFSSLRSPGRAWCGCRSDRADTQAFGGWQPNLCPLSGGYSFSPARSNRSHQAGAAKSESIPAILKTKRYLNRHRLHKQHHVAIRIGVNEASIRDLKHDVKTDRRVLMLKELTGTSVSLNATDLKTWC
jgi:hypothetical protein